MSEDQHINLSYGKEMDKDQVLIHHSKMIFDSSSLPAALNFFIDIMSFLGNWSQGSNGREIACIARGIARPILVELSLMSGAMPIESPT